MTDYANHPARAFELIDLINEYRASKGVGPMLIDHILMDLGQDYTDLLDATGKFSHTADGKYPWTRIAESGFVYESGLTGSKIGNENLHYGYSSRTGYDTPQEALEGWINSSGHNRNMLNPEWDRVGVGYRDGLYTAEFGDGPDGTVGQPPSPPPPPPPPPPSTWPANAFDASHTVTVKMPTTMSSADAVKITLGSLVDQNESQGSVKFDFFAGGQKVGTATAAIPEPGANVSLNPARAFDTVKIIAAESDVSGRVVGTSFTPLAQPPSTADGDWGAFEQEVIRLTNLERAKVGAAALRSNAELNAAADAHAEDMAAKRYFSHTSPNGDRPADRAEDVGYDSTAFGENIARGQATPAEVVAAWMNSSGHRSNILNKMFVDIGTGFEDGYWVQNFGSGDLDPYSAIA